MESAWPMSDEVIRLARYYQGEQPEWSVREENMFWTPVANGGFLIELNKPYFRVLWLRGWIGPFSEETPEIPLTLYPLNEWKYPKAA